MGTMIQKHKPTEEDYRGTQFASSKRDLKGNNECVRARRGGAARGAASPPPPLRSHRAPVPAQPALHHAAGHDPRHPRRVPRGGRRLSRDQHVQRHAHRAGGCVSPTCASCRARARRLRVAGPCVRRRCSTLCTSFFFCNFTRAQTTAWRSLRLSSTARRRRWRARPPTRPWRRTRRGRASCAAPWARPTARRAFRRAWKTRPSATSTSWSSWTRTPSSCRAFWRAVRGGGEGAAGGRRRAARGTRGVAAPPLARPRARAPSPLRRQ